MFNEVTVELPAPSLSDNGSQLVCMAALILLLPAAAQHLLNQLCKIAVHIPLGALLHNV